MGPATLCTLSYWKLLAIDVLNLPGFATTRPKAAVRAMSLVNEDEIIARNWLFGIRSGGQAVDTRELLVSSQHSAAFYTWGS